MLWATGKLFGFLPDGQMQWQQGQGSQNKALQQTRDSVLRYGEVVGCELLNLVVWPRNKARSAT